MVHCVSSKYSHHQIWKSIGATFPFIFLGRLWNCVGQDQGAHLRSTTKAMPLTLPTDTIVTNQSFPSKTYLTIVAMALHLQNFEDSRLSIQDELATTEFQIKIV